MAHLTQNDQILQLMRESAHVLDRTLRILATVTGSGSGSNGPEDIGRDSEATQAAGVYGAMNNGGGFAPYRPFEKSKNKSKKRYPDPTPWPASGYVTVPQMMHAAGNVCIGTIYKHIRTGALPKPIETSLNRVGWPVDVARQAIAELPARLAAIKSASNGA